MNTQLKTRLKHSKHVLSFEGHKNSKQNVVQSVRRWGLYPWVNDLMFNFSVLGGVQIFFPWSFLFPSKTPAQCKTWPHHVITLCVRVASPVQMLRISWPLWMDWIISRMHSFSCSMAEAASRKASTLPGEVKKWKNKSSRKERIKKEKKYFHALSHVVKSTTQGAMSHAAPLRAII